MISCYNFRRDKFISAKKTQTFIKISNRVHEKIFNNNLQQFVKASFIISNSGKYSIGTQLNF